MKNTITVDINDNTTYEYPYATQYDIGRTIEFKITENGSEYDLSNAIVIFILKKPDGTYIYDKCTVENNIAYIEITQQMVIYSGKIPCQLQISKEDSVISTISFYLKVGTLIINPDDITSNDEFNALYDMLIKAAIDYEIAKKASEEAIESARIASESLSEIKVIEPELKEINENVIIKGEEANNFYINTRSYAVGGTGTRGENEDIDNAKYYYQESKNIVVGLNGAILPQGSISFSEIPTSGVLPGYMYNITDDFVSDDRFIESGIYYHKGTNIFYTVDGKFDSLSPHGIPNVFITNEEPKNSTLNDTWLCEY